MDSNKYSVIERRMKKVCTALEANNFEAYCVATKEEALEKVKSLLKIGSTVSVGGTMTLAECGIMDELRSGKYNFLDRAAVSPEKVKEIYRQSFSADTYLCSANAVTEKGELFNIDGNGNRVAALIYGPDSVIVVAGYNKIVSDLEEAKTRLKKIAAPANGRRLGTKTYCYEAGECLSCRNNGGMTDGCKAPDRMCSAYVVNAFQRNKGRIKVILVGEELGY